jgi:hypothetical protein
VRGEMSKVLFWHRHDPKRSDRPFAESDYAGILAHICLALQRRYRIVTCWKCGKFGDRRFGRLGNAGSLQPTGSCPGAKLEGTVHASVLSGTSGGPAEIYVLHRLGMRLNEEGIEAVKKSQFKCSNQRRWTASRCHLKWLRTLCAEPPGGPKSEMATLHHCEPSSVRNWPSPTGRQFDLEALRRSATESALPSL